MDIAELATVGAKIAEIGGKLKELRAQRDEINGEITALEKELMPLVSHHAKIIADIVGAPVQPPQPMYQPNPNGTGSPGYAPPSPPIGSTTDALVQAKKRILEFLEDAEPGVSAADVASALRMDPFIVRQAMADLSRGGR